MSLFGLVVMGFRAEPPIGIELMTYALREGLEPSTAVQAATSALLVRFLSPPVSRMVQGRCCNPLARSIPGRRSDGCPYRLRHAGSALPGRTPGACAADDGWHTESDQGLRTHRSSATREGGCVRPPPFRSGLRITVQDRPYWSIAPPVADRDLGQRAEDISGATSILPRVLPAGQYALSRSGRQFEHSRILYGTGDLSGLEPPRHVWPGVTMLGLSSP
jgi:hypothetical protein